MCLLLFFGLRTYQGKVGTFFQNTRLEAKSFLTLTDQSEGRIQTGFYRKFNFIDIAGAVARTLGFSSFNGVQKLRNGYLTISARRSFNPAQLADSIAEFADFLKERRIPFLVVAAPDKRSIYDANPSPGYVNSTRGEYLSFVNALKEKGVDVLDMDAVYKSMGLGTKELFFKTDHHWNLKASQIAAQKTMEHLSAKGVVGYRPEWLEESSYRIHTLKKWFLGSHGKRVGRFFAGIDDFPVYYPLFPANYSYAGLDEKGHWFYSDSILDRSLIANRNLYENNTYCVYLYGLIPLQRTFNPNGVNAKKVLVLGDSYRMSWQFFANSQFKRMDTLEMRNYKGGTVAQYVGQEKPDLVVMVIDPLQYSKPEYKSFGVDSYRRALEKTKFNVNSVELGDLSVTASRKQPNKFSMLPVNLKSRTTYTLSVKDVVMLNGKEKFVQMSLQDISANKAITKRFFPVGEEKQKWIFSIPDNPNGTFALLLYAGVAGKTAESSVLLKDVAIQEGIHES